MADYHKPLPLCATFGSVEFWEGCRQHKLLIQKCKNCKSYRHYPRPMCPHCNSTDTEWVKVNGKGTIYTWTVTAQPFHPAYVNCVPYAVVVVLLEEGIRMASNIVDCNPEDLYIGMPVEVIFENVTEKISLPKFRPVS
ncbi:MAG: Zn-ribbon domain-containing OB-fold protein [Thermodesulfobacteriota bacterium]|nr:Zn-ribbon domain-containing OB-fold protein [Thermodesulfobacteriota bacterium]